MSVKHAAGRPPHVPTEANKVYVERMVAFGITEDTIAKIIGISKPTLRLHYRSQLDLGLAKANVAVMNNLFRQATKDAPSAFPAIRFWLNCRAGWSEYAPGPRAEPLGKKESAQLDAETALTGTSWEDLLPN